MYMCAFNLFSIRNPSILYQIINYCFYYKVPVKIKSLTGITFIPSSCVNITAAVRNINLRVKFSVGFNLILTHHSCNQRMLGLSQDLG